MNGFMKLKTAGGDLLEGDINDNHSLRTITKEENLNEESICR